jgi:hypothetical protein
MASITDLSDLINRLTGGNSGTPEVVFVNKPGRMAGGAATGPVAGRMASLWTYDGTHGSGAYATGEEVPTNTTNGALPFTAPGGSREKWLVSTQVTSTISGVFLLYDRLYHRGGLSAAIAVDQTVMGTSPAFPLTRNTGGFGNFIAYEAQTSLGGTTTTIQATYTDSDGNTGQVTPNMTIGGTGSNTGTRFQILPLAAGDKGVRAVEKIKLATTTGSGTISLVIGRPIAWFPIALANTPTLRDFTTGFPGLPKIDNTACLSWVYLASGVTPPDMSAMLSFVEK